MLAKEQNDSLQHYQRQMDARYARTVRLFDFALGFVIGAGVVLIAFVIACIATLPN